MRLIYHHLGSSGRVSPFDAALQSVANGAPLLRLASPYIGLNFLLRTVESSGEWRMLSDVEAWLQSGNQRHRAKSWAFIADNLERVRHVPDLHAKVAIGNEMLFLGSANFTEKGILGRAELSVLIEEPAQVAEATAWFDALWAAASPPILEEGDALVSALESVAWTQPRVRARLTSTAPQISAVLTVREAPTGFDLAGVMAQAGIEESRELATLEEAFRKVSDELYLSAQPFYFGELLHRVQLLSRGSSRELWRLITAETVNHWLGGLIPEGYDRYWYSKGQFHRYEKDAHDPAGCEPEKALLLLLDAIPTVPDHTHWPLEAEWIKIGATVLHILPTLELLLEVGILIEHDIPGEIERYSLDPELEWPNRWMKFAEARKRFSQIQAQYRNRLETVDDISDTHRYEGERTVIWAREEPTLRQHLVEPNGLGVARAALAKKARRMGVPLKIMIEKQDALITAIIELLSEQGSPIRTITRKQLVHELREQGLIEALHFAFNQHGMMLDNKDGGLVFNCQWAGDIHLAGFPKALDAWRKAVAR